MAARREPNVRLRDTITAVGCSYESLAYAVRRVAAENGEVLRTNKSAVCHWVNGTRPSGRTSGYIAEALSRRAGRTVTLTEIGLHTGEETAPASNDPVVAATELGRADVERRRFLAVAAFTTAGVAMPLGYDHEAAARTLRARRLGARVGWAEVEVIRQITNAFCIADEKLGGGHGLTTVTAYLADTAVPLLRASFPSDTVRANAFGAVAELVHLAGWKHHDLGHEGTAQRYYQVAYQLACEADPHGHAAWMMRALAHQALKLRQPRHCVDLIEGALQRSVGRVDSKTEGLLHITHARAFAASGDRLSGARALLAAEDAINLEETAQPSYSVATGPVAGMVASHTAKALTELKDFAGAERNHRMALTRWDTQEYLRVQVLTYADLGETLGAQGKADEAVAAWTRALDLMGGMSSERSRKAISSARATLLAYKRRGVPGASEQARRAYEVLMQGPPAASHDT